MGLVLRLLKVAEPESSSMGEGWLLGWAVMKHGKIPNSSLEIRFYPPPGKEPPSSSRTATAFVRNSARRRKASHLFPEYRHWSMTN